MPIDLVGRITALISAEKPPGSVGVLHLDAVHAFDQLPPPLSVALLIDRRQVAHGRALSMTLYFRLCPRGRVRMTGVSHRSSHFLSSPKEGARK